MYQRKFLFGHQQKDQKSFLLKRKKDRSGSEISKLKKEKKKAHACLRKKSYFLENNNHSCV